MRHPFFITDVFAETSYSGNQLATVCDAEDLAPQEMQAIAREFNFAETTFIVGGSVASGFDVRIFTPATELPFAGHPTLGTAYLLREELLKQDLSELRLNLGVGQIAVTFRTDGTVWMRQQAPRFLQRVSVTDVATALGLEAADIDDEFPARFVTTGLEFLMVPLKSYAALKRARAQSGDLTDGYFCFCRGGYDEKQQIQARMFASELGVAEDAATGSANGCLAAYLVEYRYFGDQVVDICVGQGYEIGRASQLMLQAQKTNDTFEINVGGRVRVVGEGTLR
jgi:trans-2,3-dihydro-3-hydroxyanthranilate isomerase